MAISHASPGVPVDLRPEGESFSTAVSAALVKEKAFEVIRLVISKDHEIPTHQVSGPITVQCLTGRIAFAAGDQTHDVREGQWLFLPGNVPHALRGVEDSLVLVTIMFAKT